MIPKQRFFKIGVLTLFIHFIIQSTYAYAQDYTQWGLPEGAVARLGKGPAADVSFSPDGALLAVASSIGVWLYDTATYEAVTLLNTAGTGPIAFSPDGEILISSSGSNTIKLWDVNTQQEIATLDQDRAGNTAEVFSVVFSPDGKILASGGRRQDSSSGNYVGTVKFWDVEEQKEIGSLEGHGSMVHSVVFSPDGMTLASGSWDGTILLWEVNLPSPLDLPSDINNDGSVNILDLVAITKHFGTKQGDANYNPDADMDKNGTINILDLVAVAKDFGISATRRKLHR